MPAVNTWGPVNSWQSVTSATITAVSSPRGADIAAADDTLTITVDDSSGIASVTINGVAATAVTIVDATTVTATAPHGFNAAYGSAGDVVVNNGVADSAGYPVTLMPPTGMVETAFTVDYANLDPASPFAGDAAFSAIVAGDSCIYDAQTTPDGSTVTMDGVGVFTLSPEPAADQSFDYYIHDASDHSDGPVGTITVQALTAIAEAVNLGWSLDERITGNETAQWDILTAITQGDQIAWGITERITGQAQASWSIDEHIASDDQIIWSIASVGHISDSSQIAWSVDEKIGAGDTAEWSILTAVSDASQSAWSIDERLTDSAGSAWQIAQRIESADSIEWSVLSSVSGDIQSSWMIVNIQSLIAAKTIRIQPDSHSIRVAP